MALTPHTSSPPGPAMEPLRASLSVEPLLGAVCVTGSAQQKQGPTVFHRLQPGRGCPEGVEDGAGGRRRRGWEKVTLPAVPADNWLSGTSLGHKGQLGQEAVYNGALSGGTLRGRRSCVTPGKSGAQPVLRGCSLT